MFEPNINNPKLIRTPYSSIYLVLFLSLLALSGCAQPFSTESKASNRGHSLGWLGATCPTAQISTDKLSAGAEQFEVCEPEIWGAAKNVVRIKHLYISSQPDAETFKIAREKGLELVINLGDSSEHIWEEEEAAKQAGLNYYNIPIPSTGESFDPDTIDQISALVQQHKDQKILLHCSSGNRASAWLAIHLNKDHNMPMDSAISLAKQVGLTSPAVENRIKQSELH